MEKRSQGGQKKRYKDTLEASLKDFNIPPESWKQAARGVASSEPEQTTTKLRESACLNESTKSAF